MFFGIFDRFVLFGIFISLHFSLCLSVIMSSQQNKHCLGGPDKGCGKSMPSDHVTCRPRWGESCSVSNPSNICKFWSHKTWKKHSKLVLRADKAKTAAAAVPSKSIPSSQSSGDKEH